jgi:integrase/recombinase XerD
MGAKRPKAPAGCYWKGNVLWGRSRKGGKVIQWSLETNDPRIAAEKRREKEGRIVAILRGDGVKTLHDAIEQWTLGWLDHNVRPRTADRYLVSLGQVAPFLEGKTLGDITAKLISALIEARQRRGVTNATVKRDLNALSSVFNYAVAKGWMESNPILPLYAAKVVKEKRDPVLLPTEGDIALVAARSPGMIADMVRVAIATGARQAELLTATHRQIDHGRRQLTLIGKGNKKRVIDLEPFGGYELIRRLPVATVADLLFWHSEGESYKNFASQFRAIVRSSEAWAKAEKHPFQPFRFHDLRHLHAVMWLKSGRQYRDLQHRLGHVSIQTTEGYYTCLTAEEDRIAKGYGAGGVATILATVR